VSAPNPLLSLTPEEQAKLVAQIATYAGEAREDPAVMAEFAMNTERGEPVRLVPHQRLVLRFLDDNRKSVVRMPTGASKTFLLSTHLTHQIGKDPQATAGTVSASEAQASMPLKIFKSYAEEGLSLRLVFPRLRKHPDPDAKWSDTQLEVDRKRVAKDPTIRAFGLNTQVLGARLTHLYADDVLNAENTTTLEQRDELARKFQNDFVTRVDQGPQRISITNTPWNPDDLTYRYARIWPSLTMDVFGRITITNLTVARIKELYGDLLVQTPKHPEIWRLRSPVNPGNVLSVLWPNHSRYGSKRAIEALEKEFLPAVWSRMYLCDPFADDDSRCKREWITQAMENGRGLELGLPAQLNGLRRYTGVDIGGLGGDKSDLSSIATVEVQENQQRRILNLQSGRWNGPELVRRIGEEALRYDSKVYVESNAAQRFVADHLAASDRRIQVVYFYTTHGSKSDHQNGVERVFFELMKGLWEWPCPLDGEASQVIKQLGDECMGYSSRTHMGDHLASLWLARQGLANPAEQTSGAHVGSPTKARGGGF
jgi:hypothetical protein